MAFLHGGARTATCTPVTPCALYELRRDDLEAVVARCPAMEEALNDADLRRRDALTGTAGAAPHHEPDRP